MYSISEVSQFIWQLNIDDGKGDNHLEGDTVELFKLMDTLVDKPDLRVLMLRGRQEVFLTGASPTGLDKFAGNPRFRVRATSFLNHLTLARFAAFPLPVVGALEGHAVGGGLCLALTFCDLTYVADSSRYGANFANMGFSPSMGTNALLPALAGQALGNEMILGGKLYRGSELQGRGLFTHVLPKDKVYPAALDMANRIAEKPRNTLEVLKNQIATARRRALIDIMPVEDCMHRITMDDPAVMREIQNKYIAP